MVSTIFPHQILQTSSATITTWLPLSTAWPSTAACSSLVVFGSGNDARKLFGWDPLYQVVRDTGSPRCFADEMASWWLELSSVTISLGPNFNCPAAYSTVATSVHSAGVTQVFCCPTDYKLSVLIPSHSYGDYPTQCMSTLKPGDVLKYQTPTDGIYQPASSTVSDTVFVYGEHINGWNIDDALFASMTGGSQSSSNTASTTSTTPTTTTSSSTNGEGLATTKTLESATASSTPITSNKSSNTSPALAAGVGVAAAIIILGLAAALFLFIRRQRRKKDANPHINTMMEINSTETYPSQSASASASVYHPIHPATELSNERPLHEMDGGIHVGTKGYYDPTPRLRPQHMYEM
ncbi:hypothetical protein SBOR_0625 [Sclerotinia borealis F-4128]|uniref:LPXTG-domain-containing protein n=1 Tax=Sclerotinia borealis (strain F-4128) TaxID=1432307 RepID=W9CQ78_SCLBF|nr:hypothetical protein SBOR_0625 [Sclerotinia borealis F-4128]